MNPLHFDPNDSRFTAYLLDEASEVDRAAVEAILEHNAEARKFVDDQRAAIFELEAALACEVDLEPTPKLELSTPTTEVPVSAAPVVARRLSFRTRFRLAAAVMICAGTAGLIWNDMQRQDERASVPSSNEVAAVDNVSLFPPKDGKDKAAAQGTVNGVSQGGMPSTAVVMRDALSSFQSKNPKASEKERPDSFEYKFNRFDLQLDPARVPERTTAMNSQSIFHVTSARKQGTLQASPAPPMSQEKLLKKVMEAEKLQSERDGLVSQVASLDSAKRFLAEVGGLTDEVLGNKAESKRESLMPTWAGSGLTGDVSLDPNRLANSNVFGVPFDIELGAWLRSQATGAVSKKPVAPPTLQDILDAENLVSSHYVHHSVGHPAEDMRTLYTAPMKKLTPPIIENPFLSPDKAPLSTFSIDVDTGSYANVRRYINAGQRPPKDAVRIEELLNNFHYGDAEPKGEHPIAITLEAAPCPWQMEHKLLRIGLKAKSISETERPITNLVFLIDVSGSMQDSNKLPLLKEGMKVLVERLTENDRVAIVTYSGQSGLVLPSTSGHNKAAILSAIEGLRAKGSTNGGAGIQMAYEQAVKNFVTDGQNRVVLATDGDFNMGITDRSALEKLIQEKAKTGVFLSVLGFGTGNVKDVQMEQIANKGNGNYSYIDQIAEAEKVLGRELLGTLITVAKDVKLQVEFNPAHVAAYRLIGYENRTLKAQDFNNDQKDAGEVGAGHSVMALYQVVPVGTPVAEAKIDDLRYRSKPLGTLPKLAPITEHSDEWLNVKVRYKQPSATSSTRFDVPLKGAEVQATLEDASPDLRWSSAVAAFGLMLRDSAFKGQITYAGVFEIAGGALGDDEFKDRAGFLKLVQKVVNATSR